MGQFTFIPCRSDGTTVRPLVVGQEVDVIHAGRRQRAWITMKTGDTYLLRCSDGSRVTRDRMSIAE